MRHTIPLRTALPIPYDIAMCPSGNTALDLRPLMWYYGTIATPSSEALSTMTFQEVIERLRDGKRYHFGHANLKGHFHKAPFPSELGDEAVDHACSAITFYSDRGEKASPTLMLFDFDDDTEWYCVEVPFRFFRSLVKGGAPVLIIDRPAPAESHDAYLDGDYAKTGAIRNTEWGE